jgi:DNA-binding response OmpR family regulator
VPTQEVNQSRLKISTHDTFKILLIDEDDNLLRKMMPLFNTMDVRVDHATNPAKAIILANRISYDLVVLDINQHTDNNLDLIKILREHQPNLDFITITGDNPRSMETSVRELRVLYHLVKPFSTKELSSVIRHISKRSINNSRQ